jgi:Heat induced stress protein YflT domain
MAITHDSTYTARGGQSVASYKTYDEAQRAVDYLSDSDFPVESAAIVGSDVRIVEQVTGRLTSGRAALAGAGTGAPWGLFIGLLVGLFTTDSEWLGLVLGGLIIGAAWGALLGLVFYWATQGRRDFTSDRGLVAERYDVMVTDELAERARTLLAQLR